MSMVPLRHEMDGARCFVSPDRAFPGAEHLGAERDEAVEAAQETWQDPFDVRHDDVQVRGHRAERMDLETIATGRHGERIGNELGDFGIRSKEQMAAQGTTREEISRSGSDPTRQAHGHMRTTNSVPPRRADEFR